MSECPNVPECPRRRRVISNRFDSIRRAANGNPHVAPRDTTARTATTMTTAMATRAGDARARATTTTRVRQGVRFGARRAATGRRRAVNEAPLETETRRRDDGASARRVYDGTVLFHVYDTLEAPKPIFGTFLEGALHVVEVARFHPNFVSAHFHYALGNGEERIDAREPNACFNCALFDDVAPEDMFAAFSDFVDAVEMGHLNQTEHALACREIAAYAPSDADGASAFARTRAKRREMIEAAEGSDAVVPVFGFDESNVVIFVGVKANAGGVDANDWTTTFGITSAQAIVGAGAFQDASLFEVVKSSKANEVDHRFTHVARVSLGPVGQDEALVSAAEDVIRRACAAIDPSALIAPYACVYNIGKKGTPPGALPAMREIAKKKKENDEMSTQSTRTTADV